MAQYSRDYIRKMLNNSIDEESIRLENNFSSFKSPEYVKFLADFAAADEEAKRKKKEEKEKEKALKKYKSMIDADKKAIAKDKSATDTLRETLKGSMAAKLSLLSDDPLRQESNQKRAKEIANLRARLEAVGVNPDEAIDDRNAFEKWANLPKGQNWFFDTLELLDRPLMALRGVADTNQTFRENIKEIDPKSWESLDKAIKAGEGFLGASKFDGFRNLYKTIKGLKNEQDQEDFLKFYLQIGKKAKDEGYIGNLGKSMLEGVSGRKDFDNLVKISARSNQRANPNAEDWAKGLGAEIIADPLNLVGAGIVSKVGKGIKKGSDVIGATELANKAWNATPVKTVRDVLDRGFGTGGRNRKLDGTIDDLNQVKEVERKWMTEKYNRMDDSSKNIVNTIKDAGGDWETGVVVGHIMELPNLQSRKGNLDKKIMELQKRLGQITSTSKKKIRGAKNKETFAQQEAKLRPEREAILKELNEIKNGQEYKDLVRHINTSEDLIQNARPELLEAAENMIRSNEDILELARNVDYDLDEIIGYMAHRVTDDYEEFIKETHRSMTSSLGTEPNKVGFSKGVLSRNMEGTVAEINEKAVKQGKPPIFNPNAYFATAKGQHSLIKFLTMEGFKKDILSNRNFAIPISEVKEGTIVKDWVKVKADDFRIVGEELPFGFKPREGEYYVTKGVAEALENFKRVINDDATLSKLGQGIDKVNRVWKKLATFSPTYHTNNGGGAMFNQYVGGMSVPEVVEYNSVSASMLSDVPKLLEKVRKGETLKKSDEEVLQLYNEFKKQGLSGTGLHGADMTLKKEGDILKDIAYQTKGVIGKAVEHLKNPLKALDTSREVAEKVDEVTRFALFKWMIDKGKKAPEAAGKVREVLFDYNDITEFERKVMRRVIPFYTFTRKNIPFMLKSFVKNPQKFQRLNRITQSGYSATGQDKELTPEYLKNRFNMPLSEGKSLAIDLPSADLGKLGSVDDLTKLVGNMVTPIAKAPAEFMSNRNFFMDMPLKTFKDQKSEALGIDPRYEHALTSFVPPLRNIFKANEGDKTAVDVLLESLGVKDYERDKYESGYLFDRQTELLNAIQRRKQEGFETPTINDLKKVGLVSKDQASEKQVKESKQLLEMGRKAGLDPSLVEILPRMKQRAMSSTEDELVPIIEALQNEGVPDAIIRYIIKDHLKIK